MDSFGIEKKKERFQTKFCVICGKEIPKPDLNKSFTTQRAWNSKKYCCLRCVYKSGKINKPKNGSPKGSYFDKWMRGEEI